MKKLLAISIIPILILSGCGAKSNKVKQPQSTQQVQQDDDEEMSWFEDEVLDMDDWGESKHKKVKPKTSTSKSTVTKPSVGTKSPTVKSKPSTTKKKSWLNILFKVRNKYKMKEGNKTWKEIQD